MKVSEHTEFLGSDDPLLLEKDNKYPSSYILIVLVW